MRGCAVWPSGLACAGVGGLRVEGPRGSWISHPGDGSLDAGGGDVEVRHHLQGLVLHQPAQVQQLGEEARRRTQGANQ